MQAHEAVGALVQAHGARREEVRAEGGARLLQEGEPLLRQGAAQQDASARLGLLSDGQRRHHQALRQPAPLRRAAAARLPQLQAEILQMGWLVHTLIHTHTRTISFIFFSIRPPTHPLTTQQHD